MALARMPAAVVFDMDGLLFDTETLYREAALAAAAAWGHELPDLLFLSLVGRPWMANRAALLDHYGAGFAVDAFQAEWVRQFEAIVEARLALKPGVGRLLDLLDELRLPRAIATSSHHADVRRNLAAHGIAGRFDAVVAHGDYARGKPAPDPFLLAAERLGVPPQRCLALEDSHNGVRSAAAAGMAVVMVPDLLEATAEMQGLCRFVAQDLDRVCEAILAVRLPLGG
ncbi:hydrolase [Allostella sp. ATCC 35155]|nr:hydrolase [Stella sp. ATCC 35155]